MNFFNFDTVFIVFSIFALLSAIAKLLEVNGFLLNEYAGRVAKDGEEQASQKGCAALSILLVLTASGVAGAAWRLVGHSAYDSFAFLIGFVLQIGFFLGSWLYVIPKLPKIAENVDELKRIRRFTAISGGVQLAVTVYALLTI